MNRRDFLKTTGLAAAAGAVGVKAGDVVQDPPAETLTRVVDADGVISKEQAHQIAVKILIDQRSARQTAAYIRRNSNIIRKAIKGGCNA